MAVQRQVGSQPPPYNSLDLDHEMKDISRLAVGIILLGLAIFLTVDFEVAPTQSAGAEPSEDSGLLEPNWQAAVNQEPSDARKLELATAVRPQFDEVAPLQARPLQTVAQPVRNLGSEDLVASPVRSTQAYIAPEPVVGGRSLVPVQPKPSFTGKISYVQRMHTIREGDSLPSIAREYFGNAQKYLDIYLLNKDVLANPTQLPVGVEIKIPAA